MNGVAIATFLALVLFAIPLVLALANMRGWLRERMWHGRHRETWLDRRPWVGSIALMALWSIPLVAHYRAGDPRWWRRIPIVLVWGLLPYLGVAGRRQFRDAERAAQRQGGDNEHQG